MLLTHMIGKTIARSLLWRIIWIGTGSEQQGMYDVMVRTIERCLAGMAP